jgi:hypothetical protein
MSLQFTGRLSARLGSSLSMYFELTRATAHYTQAGFHPVVGFLPEPRVLSETELKLWTSCLKFLKAGFERNFKELSNKADALEFSMWIYAAHTLAEFILTVTRVVPAAELPESQGFGDQDGASMGVGPYSVIPPHIETRKLTELEQETYEASLEFLCRSHFVTASDELLLQTAGMVKMGPDDGGSDDE